MRVVKAVIIDLTTFAVDTVSQLARRLLPAKQERLALPGVGAVGELPGSGRYFVSEHSIDQLAPMGTIHFVGTGDRTLYVHPTVTFDGALAVLPYAEQVLVHHFGGRFAAVSAGSVSGWMLKDTLFVEQEQILPRFTVGSTYDSEHDATRKLRQAIEDDFLGDVLKVPLASVEYVTYKLWKAGKRIPWGEARPREAGQWQRLLKGVQGVHSGISPKTGSVMEHHDNGTNILAYVDAVAPDETIRISMIDDEDGARYLEQELVKESWRELRPVFISVL